MLGKDEVKPQPQFEIPAAGTGLFNELYRKHYDGFVRFADSYIRDKAVAEDLVTESFMTFWDNRQVMLPGSNVRAYLLTVLKNKCLNHLKLREYRKKQLQNISEVSQWDLQMRITTLNACNPEEVFSAEIQDLVNQAIKELPPRTLEVFLLSRYQMKSNKEIAEMLGISVKGVEFHMTKALGLLRISLKDYLPILILLHFI